jgi:hypothetical protein
VEVSWKDTKAGELITRDVLVRLCGFFTSDTDTFGGYGCTHPDQEARDPGTGEGQCDGCPIAWRLCPDQEERDAQIMIADGLEPDNADGEWLAMNDDLAKLRRKA